MVFTPPLNIISTREQVLRGHTFHEGQALTPDQIKALPHLSALLSNGRLKATPDPHMRREHRGTTPTALPPAILRGMPGPCGPGPTMAQQSAPVGGAPAELGAEVLVEDLKATVTISGGTPLYRIEWSDGASSQVGGTKSTHTFAEAGTYSVTITDATGESVEADFEVG